jgi:uncharacterized protein (DUF58 family)
MSRASAVAALGICLCLLAAAFGAASLYVPGIALLLLWAAAELSVHALARGLHVHREPATATVEEGAPLPMEVTLGGVGLTLGGGELVRWPGAPAEPLRRAARRPIRFDVRLQRRGEHVIGPSVVRYGDPFGLRSRERASAPSKVLVLPRVETVDRVQLQRLVGSARRERIRAVRPGASELEGLGPYRPGTPASRIHWRSFARTGELLEQRLGTDTDLQPLVVIDAERPLDAGALDAAVRAAASLCVGLAATGGCSVLIPGAARPRRLTRDLAAWPSLHVALALVQAGERPARTGEERASVLFWVTAGEHAPAALRSAAPGTHYLVTPFPRGDSAVLVEVAGCAVQAVAGRAGRVAA